MASVHRLLQAVDDAGELEPLVYSLEQAARLVGIGRSTAYELVARHDNHLPVDRPDGQVLVPVLRIGSRRLVSRAALTQAVQGAAPSP